MISMRFLRPLALAALASISACHDDPEVVTIVVNVLSQGVSLNGAGGSATLNGGGNSGVGGLGGRIAVTAFGPVTVGTAPTPPADPATPSVPTGFTATNTVTETATTGNLLIPSINVTGNASYFATNGDIIVAGTLQPDPAGPSRNIALTALNGTVYV